MARITLELTEEQVKIVRCLRFKKIDINRSGKDILRTVNELDRIAESIGDEESEPRVALLREGLYDIKQEIERLKAEERIERDKYYGFDTYDLFGGMKPYEFLAFILGRQKDIIPGTEEDYDGPKFPPEVIDEFEKIIGYVYERMVDIEDLIHQRCDCGGIQPNVKYIALDHERIWRTEEEFEEYRKKK